MTTPLNATLKSGKISSFALLTLKILAGAVFVGAGLSKLAGLSDAVDLFAKIGLGQGFRYLTGSIELLCAIALFIRGLTYYSATLLAAVMIAAIAFHLAVIGGSAVPPAVLLVMLVVIAYLSRAGGRNESG